MILYILAVENSKETTALLKFNKRDYITQVSDIEDKIYVGNDKYKKMVEIRDRLRSNKNELLQEIVDLNSSLEKVDVEEFDIDVLNKSKSEIIQKIENLNINQIEGECEAFILSNNEIETQIKEYERKDLENIKDSVSEWKTELLHIESEIEVLKVEVKNRLDKVKALDSHEYDENCKYCMKNVFVQDALKAKSELDKLKPQVSTKLSERDNINNKISQYPNIDDEYAEYLRLKSVFDKNESEWHKCINRVKVAENDSFRFKSELEKVEFNIAKYNENQDAQKFNRKIKEKIVDLNSDI